MGGYRLDLHCDYTLAVPKEISDMAIKIEEWFKESGITQWELMGICSRDHVYELEVLRKKLNNIEKIIQEI